MSLWDMRDGDERSRPLPSSASPSLPLLPGILIRILNNESMNQETRFFLSPRFPKRKGEGVQSRKRRSIARRSEKELLSYSLWRRGRRSPSLTLRRRSFFPPFFLFSSFNSLLRFSLYCVIVLANNSTFFAFSTDMESYSTQKTTQTFRVSGDEKHVTVHTPFTTTHDERRPPNTQSDMSFLTSSTRTRSKIRSSSRSSFQQKRVKLMKSVCRSGSRLSVDQK